jgi:hypothetical protein
MLIPGMLIRRALKGELPLIAAAKKLQDDLLSRSVAAASFGEDGALEEEVKAVATFKKVTLMVLGTAMQTYGQKLTDEQEVLTYIADIVMDTYASESAVLRAKNAAKNGIAQPQAELHEYAARVFVNDAAQRVEMTAKSALAAMSEGDTLRTLLAALRRLMKVSPINTVALRRRLADATTAKGSYIFG